MSEMPTVVVIFFCPFPITVIVALDDPADTESPALNATAATVPAIGVVSTA